MRIGILETGVPPAALAGVFGSYAAMVRRLLGEGAEIEVFHIPAGHFPDRPESCDAYVITGSSAGVYDDLPWIPQLTAFLRATKGRAKLVGLCFGHQIMAEAFGGRVEKSPKGWGLGLQTYAIHAPRPWMDRADPIAIPVSHQDQVVSCPPEAHVIGGNAFTPIGVLAYEDQAAISFQCHPEFELAYATALIEGRRAILPDRATADAFVASLRDAPNDRARVAEWIRRFLGLS